MVKTIPGNITPDFRGSKGRVTISLVIVIPFQVVEFT
jgi:hypothetical protein